MDAFRKGNETNWKKLTDRFQSLGITVATKDSGKYKVKFLLGTDAVHGDQHTVGNVLFPHNIGLSCSKNEANFENVGFWTKQGVKRSGFNYVFAPTVAVSHNPQWGRFYETLGQDADLIEKFSQAYVRGVQDVSNGKINGALATAKHFLGDGSTLFGCNEGNANVLNFKNYISRNTRGYTGAVKANAGSVMVSYSAINWIPNSVNSHFLLGTLREDIGFNGFTISDYDDLENLNNNLMPRTFMNFTAE
jgi:beta-glucosidase